MTVKRLLVVVALSHAVWILWLRWGTPLNSPHAFRETETAMDVYYMLHGGHFLRYWTPVMGPPWTIPFEFPTFQWLVAGVAYVSGIGLDNAGRLVSFLCGIGGIVPLRKLCRTHAIDPDVCSALYLAAPLYAFWNTTFLIETCSLFLCLMFLWMVEEGCRWWIMLPMACLAALTKVTTFIPFVGLSVLVVNGWRRPLVFAAIALGAAVMWNHYTDMLKANNPLSTVLISSQPAQKLHDFGTLQQRLSWQPPETAVDTIKRLF